MISRLAVTTVLSILAFLATGCATVTEKTPGPTIKISLERPGFILRDTAGKQVLIRGQQPAPARTKGALATKLKAWYEPIVLPDGGRLDTVVNLRWFPSEKVYRKTVEYRISETQSCWLVEEVVVDRKTLRPQECTLLPGDTQSYPVFGTGVFAGIEYPVASTRFEDGRIVLAHRPGTRIEPGKWHTSRPAVFGECPKGQERQSFLRYVAGLRPAKPGLHINYNSWWTLPCPYYTEKDTLELMQVFQSKMYEGGGGRFDTFCIDMGWSDPKSIWQIDKKQFPLEFRRLRAAGKKMECAPGLWISPSSCYPTALDAPWAKSNGYEVLKDGRLCLGGEKYAKAFRERLREMVKRGVRHIKLDGCVLRCCETDHGHEPGSLSTESIAEGFIAAVQNVRRANPEVWLEPTCFGWNPSPWWLMYCDSVIGSYGDDAPFGRVPNPIYRDSYTTARDYYNLQGAQWSPIPIEAQEVLGIIHQTPEPFMDDAVTTVLRGNQFLPVYLNPKFMDARRWQMFSALLGWARSNEELICTTIPLLPVSWQEGRCPKFSENAVMPREPYGYFHWAAQKGLVLLRNPWIESATYHIALSEANGVPTGLKDLSIVSLYPEVRVYSQGLGSNAELDVPVAPYETLVLSIAKNQPTDSLPAISQRTANIQCTGNAPKVRKVVFTGDAGPGGPDWTSLVGDTADGIECTITNTINFGGANAELLILTETAKPAATPILLGTINGREVQYSESDSSAGWGASVLSKHEYWRFLRIPLVCGENILDLRLILESSACRISGWIWETKPGKESFPPAYPNALPEPETISLDSVNLFDVTPAQLDADAAAPLPRPIERINGVYLDTLAPVSVTQGWGTLRTNQSVWEKPMTIAGHRYVRGLGTHAPSRIVYALDAKFSRFQAWAGPDGATTPTVSFEVIVDGKSAWKSGNMTFGIPAQWVDLDVRNAKTLELLVGDGGNGLGGDHADWAMARLLY